MNTSSLFSLKTAFAIGLIVFGIITRYALKDLPNIETITSVTILAGALLGGGWGMVVGIATVAGSDMLIGNTNILYYTWSAWLLVGLFGLMTRYSQNAKLGKQILKFTGAGLVSNLLFFAWTNFGVWHIGGLYPHTASGLMESYVMGLPFLRNQLLSTLVMLPAVSVVAIAVWNKLPAMLESRRSAVAAAHAAQK